MSERTIQSLLPHDALLKEQYDAIRDEAELACIRAVCPACEQGQMPALRTTLPYGLWMHSGLSICNASGIYRLRHKREEKLGAD